MPHSVDHFETCVFPRSKLLKRVMVEPVHCYEWADFVLAVLYRSPRRHSNSSKTFSKNRKKLKYILRLDESFKLMNRPDPTRHGPTMRLALWRLIYRKVYWGREIFIQSSLQTLICAIIICECYALFDNVAISVIFSSFFIIIEILNSDGFIGKI